VAKLFPQKCPNCGGTYRVELEQRGNFECAGCNVPCDDLAESTARKRAVEEAQMALYNAQLAVTNAQLTAKLPVK
jgi:transposase-like protein